MSVRSLCVWKGVWGGGFFTCRGPFLWLLSAVRITDIGNIRRNYVYAELYIAHNTTYVSVSACSLYVCDASRGV